MMKKWLYGIVLLCGFPLLGGGQSLDEVIRLAQDSTITAFQSRYQFEYYSQRYAQFQALLKPQLELSLTPNYMRTVNDPTRSYVYLRNFDRFSTSAQLRLNQKVLGWGGDAYVESQAVWSEYFGRDANAVRPRDFIALPLSVGYQQSLLGYNPYRWEKAMEEDRMEAARKQLNHELRLIAEEATRRYFRLACAQGILDMCLRNQQTADTLYAITREKAGIAMVSLAELRSLELQRLNAANALLSARNEELLARESLAAYLRTDILPSGSRLTVPTHTRQILFTDEDILEMARSNSPALQQQHTALTQALGQEQKARRERGVKVGVDLSMGLQYYNTPQFFTLASVSFRVPIMDHGASQKGYAAASAWKNREEQALREEERALAEDVRTTLEKLRAHEQILTQTEEAVGMADDVFQLTADNYANGLCDINTYSLAQSRRDEAYNQHLSALAGYWITYYHLLTLTQHE